VLKRTSFLHFHFLIVQSQNYLLGLDTSLLKSLQQPTLLILTLYLPFNNGSNNLPRLKIFLNYKIYYMKKR